MSTLKSSDMATIKELDAIEQKIADRIAALIREVEPTAVDYEKAGYRPDTLSRKALGKNLAQFLKLWRLAKMLKTTPNDILCFPEGEDRQAFIGLLEGMGLARGLPPGQAALLAETVAAKLDSPAIRNGGISPRDTARILALEAIHQILPKERL